MIALVGDQVAGIFRRRSGATEADRFFFASFNVGFSVLVSPSSAGWIGAATMTPLSRSTACSGL